MLLLFLPPSTILPVVVGAFSLLIPPTLQWTSISKTSPSSLLEVAAVISTNTDNGDNNNFIINTRSPVLLVEGNSNNATDNRPFVQRVAGPRPARRLNHVFQHLYRHHDHDDDDDETINSINNHTANANININNSQNDDDVMDYLMQYVSKERVVAMNQSFPPLLTLSIQGQLHPKMRFLKDTILKLSSSSSSSSSSSATSSRKRREELRFLLEAQNDMIPPQFFGARLERTLAPRHAFLVHARLPHGRDLLFPVLQTKGFPPLIKKEGQNDTTSNTATRNYPSTKWHAFLVAQRNTKQFAALCQQWQREQQRQGSTSTSSSTASIYPMITSKQVEAFEAIFSRGLMAAARNEWNPHEKRRRSKTDNNTHDDAAAAAAATSSWWPWQYIDKNHLTSAQVLDLLIQHGANPNERDYRGASLLHWASGSGNLAAVKVLLRASTAAQEQHPPPHHHESDKKKVGVWTITTRDGATPLHWAAAGSSAREFGTGGHLDVCRYLLEQVTTTTGVTATARTATGGMTKSITASRLRKQYVNQRTFDGNSALMWAAWSGSLDTVKLLVRESRSQTAVEASNRNGCTVAHWAASGGNLAVCQYLYETARVDFSQPNHGGNTPLTHAVAFGRTSVVAWLKETVLAGNDGDNNSILDSEALQLARDFVQWTNGQDERRQEVLDIFQEM